MTDVLRNWLDATGNVANSIFAPYNVKKDFFVFPYTGYDLPNYDIKQPPAPKVPPSNTTNVTNTSNKTTVTNVYNNVEEIYNTTNINITINVPDLPQLPPKRLPKEADKQTATKTPAGSSIPVSESIKNRKFGRLIWNPYNLKEYSVRAYKEDGFSDLIKKSQETSAKEFQKWFDAQESASKFQNRDYLANKKRFLQSSVVLFPDSTNGGKLALMFGIDSLLLIADNYRIRSSNALLPPCDFLVTKYKKEDAIKLKSREYPDIGNIEFLGENTLYYRSGHDNLPATVPESLITKDKDDEKTITIENALDFFAWKLLQDDAILGQFPIKIKFKDKDGQEKNLKLDNIAETLAEVIGVALNAANDANLGISIGMRNLTETLRTFNTALLALDHIQAQTDYMGFKGREYKRKVKYSINPFAKKLKDLLIESEQDFVGYKLDDKEDLQKQLKTIMLAAEIIRASLYHPFNKSKPTVTGDSIIKDKKDKEKQENEDWTQLKQKTENPTGIRKVNDLKPKIQDISKSENPQE